MSIESVMPSNHLILCRPLLLPPSIFPSIRVFSCESVLHIRWPKYWSFSFSISDFSLRRASLAFSTISCSACFSLLTGASLLTVCASVHFCYFESNLRRRTFFHLYRFLNSKQGFVHRKEHDPALPLLKFSSVAQSCRTLCDPKDCSMPHLPVHHQLPKFTQTHVH